MIEDLEALWTDHVELFGDSWSALTVELAAGASTMTVTAGTGIRFVVGAEYMLERGVEDEMGRIEGQLGHANQRLALYVEERIGRDQRYETIFTERYHFVEAGLDEDAKSALTRAIVHGGITTPFSTRPVAVSGQDARSGGPDFTANVSSTPHTFAPLSQSPLHVRTKTKVIKTARRRATL
ncbi:MAG: hypothetical protein IIB17_07495, partial [Chloroflexi bacterium]|nr:hypothetical protein [Chloroflexota bacterium]